MGRVGRQGPMACRGQEKGALAGQPNVLFLMADMMQGQVLRSGHVCQRPHLDRLAERGVRFERAYTPSAICGPARASLMTGLLPHSHGVVENTQCVDFDQGNIRPDKPHWAQRLRGQGYRTGYFGKWHVERNNELGQFGWDVDGSFESKLYRKRAGKIGELDLENPEVGTPKRLEGPEGYPPRVIYGVTEQPAGERSMGVVADMAEEFLEECFAERERPWCCFVSFIEPHNPYTATQATLDLYDASKVELPASAHDDMMDKPGLYRKIADLWADWSDADKKEAMLSYFARITEVDQQLGRVIKKLEESGQANDTIVVFASDHGQLNWAHGGVTMNYSAFEECYNIPLVVSGPGVAAGAVSRARVGLHDLCPTLLGLTGCEPIDVPDSRSFASVLRDPKGCEGDYDIGYGEFYGARYRYSHRVLWKGDWKFVLNGFDYNEMYNLKDDPAEMCNLAGDRHYHGQMCRLMAEIWRIMKDTGDMVLYRSNFPTSRMAPVGSNWVDAS